jgi:transposase
MDRQYDLYVGIDWGSQRHVICVLDAQGQVLHEARVDNTGRGLAGLAEQLTALGSGQPQELAVAIEQPAGAVVETLLARGMAVFSLNPKQLDRFRDRHRPAGSKDDRLDARVLADSLRTDRPAFRPVAVLPQDTQRLRELVRSEIELSNDLRRHANQLRAVLQEYYPQLLELAGAADEPWIWDLVKRAPLPAQAARLQEGTLAALLKRHRIRRVSAAQLSALLRTPAFYRAPGAAEASSEHALLLVERLELIHRQLVTTRQRVGRLVDAAHDAAGAPQEGEHRDAQILRSLPGVGRFITATMLAEAPEALRDRDYHRLRAEAGQAPVTKASGKSRRVQMRRAHNERLTNACYHMARVAIMHDPAAREHYQRLRQRGGRHAAALRGVADRLLRILIAMLRDGTLYDPARTRSTAAVPTQAA